MQFIIDNWYVLLAFVAVGVFIGYAAAMWIKMPKAKQIESIKQYLRFAVLEAEKQLGTGTGQAKLRMVYDMALSKFAWLSFVSFNTFSTWVDEALVWLNFQLEENRNISEYVNGENK